MATPPKVKSKAQEVAELRAYYQKNGHVPTLLSNVSTARFGESDSKRVSELGALVARGKLTRAEAEKRVRQGAGVSNEDTRRAGLDVSAELDPKINSAARRRAMAKAGYTEDTAAAKQRTEAGIAADTSTTEANRSKIQAIYETLLKTMQGTTPAVNSLYDAQSAANATGTASLQEKIRAAYDQANAGTQAQVAALGGGQTQGQLRGSQDSAFLSGLAGIQGQGISGMLQAGQLGAQGIQQASVYGSGREGADRQADMLAELMARSGKSRESLNEFNREATRDWREEDQEYGGQIADLEETRYSKLHEGKKALAEARAQATQEAEDREFERRLAEAKLNVDRDKVDVSRMSIKQRASEAASRLGLDRERLTVLSKQSAAKLANEQRKYTPGTPEYEEVQAAIDLQRAQAAAVASNARTNQQRVADTAANNNVKNQLTADKLAQKAPKAANFGKGVGGAQTYIKQGIRPEFHDNANRVLAYLNRTQAGDKIRGAERAEEIIRKYKYPPDVAQGIRRMVGIYYGSGS